MWIINALLVVFIIVAGSILGLYWTRNKQFLEYFREHHDVSGYTFGIIGVVYAVLLGFTVVTVQEKFNQAHQAIETESNYITDLYRDAEVFDKETQDKIHDLLKGYVHLVLNDEWPKMANREMSALTALQMKKIWAAYADIRPTDERESIWLSQSLSKLNEFSATRLSRLFHGNESLGPMMWVLLIVGASITISFIFLFHVRPLWLHAIMTASLAGLIGFMLFLIGELDQAYSGTVQVSSFSIERVQKLLEKWEKG
ncbi:MAG: DUF4239 domain-containing protein [Parachlamydiaceae bacterium]